MLTYDTKGRGEYFSTPFLLYVYGLGVLALHAFAWCATVVVRVVWHSKHNVYGGHRTMRLMPKTLYRMGSLVEAIQLFHRFNMIIIENKNGSCSNQYINTDNLKYT